MVQGEELAKTQNTKHKTKQSSHFKVGTTTFYQRCFINQAVFRWDRRGLEFIHRVRVKFSKRDTTKPYKPAVL